MLERQPGKLGRLLGGELSPGSGTRAGIDNASECRPSIGKPRDDERDGAGMTPLKRGIDGIDSLPAHGALYGGEQLQLGRVDRPNRAACGAHSIALRLAGFGGLPVFEGSLARPVQGSRYWSRSHPLPRSRSFQ